MDVLIVENDVVVARMWTKKLAREHSVRVATSIAKAHKEIEVQLPDVVLLDLRLNGPTNSGLTIYEFIRSELKEETPIIFITGLAYNVDLFQKAQAFTKTDKLAGISTWLLEKPVKINELASMVNQVAA